MRTPSIKTAQHNFFLIVKTQSNDVAKFNEINAEITRFLGVWILENVVISEVFILKKISNSFHGHACLQRADHYDKAKYTDKAQYICISSRYLLLLRLDVSNTV